MSFLTNLSMLLHLVLFAVSGVVVSGRFVSWSES